MMSGSRKEKVPGCSGTPAPVGAVPLVELLKVSVGMVVEFGLEVEVPFVESVLFWETTCWELKMISRRDQVVNAIVKHS